MQTAIADPRPAGTGRREGKQFLTFSLGHESYAVDILAVQEIRGAAHLTPLPNTPPHVLGVMNLRGAVVPVIDLRVRIGMAPGDGAQAIIIFRMGAALVGAQVDAVEDVVDVPLERLQPAPEIGPGGRFVSGLFDAGESLVAVLEPSEFLGEDARSSVDPPGGPERA